MHEGQSGMRQSSTLGIKGTVLTEVSDTHIRVINAGKLPVVHEECLGILF
jgi:hypothetical protein